MADATWLTSATNRHSSGVTKSVSLPPALLGPVVRDEPEAASTATPTAISRSRFSVPGPETWLAMPWHSVWVFRLKAWNTTLSAHRPSRLTLAR